jgi:hypothetical protein
MHLGSIQTNLYIIRTFALVLDVTLQTYSFYLDCNVSDPL